MGDDLSGKTMTAIEVITNTWHDPPLATHLLQSR
jgi:hypothetical protein